MPAPVKTQDVINKNHPPGKLGDPRFRLHDIASRILLDPKFGTKEEKEKIDAGIYPRVTKCQKIPFINGNKSSHVDGVPLKRSKQEGFFGFGGLFSCASVWSCPICSSRIADTRCQEISRAFEIWQEIGKDGSLRTWSEDQQSWVNSWGDKDSLHSQVMISFTVPHYVDQSISDLRESFMNSRRALKRQDELKKNPSFMPWKIICKEFGVKGTISAVEVTYGFNGWHPHSHDIFFLDRKLDHEELEELRTRLTTAWVYACKRSDVRMSPDQETYMYQRSVNVRNAPTAEEYISKFGYQGMSPEAAKAEYEKFKDVLNPGWGAAQELTKSHIKMSRGDKGYTPWDFLRIIDEFPDNDDVYLQFGRLFRDYSRTFFGSRQLFWSKGFKEELISYGEATGYILSDL